MPHWKVDIPSLYLAVETVKQHRRMSAREVAEEVGVSPSTMTRLKDGQRLEVDAFVSLLAWLGAEAQRFVLRVDGTPEPDEDKPRVSVDPRDVLIAWSWAREALAALPERLLPQAERRLAVTQALQRLHDEVGPWAGGEQAPGEPSGNQEALYGRDPARSSVEGCTTL